MKRIIKNVLKRIEDSNYEAYLVGGYVRDYLLHKKTYDIDVCTNANTIELQSIFPEHKLVSNYGSVRINIGKYEFDITTYRKELKYEKRKPITIEIAKSLEEDLKRRDFTINAICMDRLGNIIDPYKGIEDLKCKRIKMIGNIDKKIKEDSLRILRAIRFASKYNFVIDEELSIVIKNNYKLVKSLSSYRIKEELTKILSNKNYYIGLSLLNDYKIADVLNIKYENVKYYSDIYKMWAQIKFADNLQFTKEELRHIIKAREKFK